MDIHKSVIDTSEGLLAFDIQQFKTTHNFDFELIVMCLELHNLSLGR